MERTIWYKKLASGTKVRGWVSPEPDDADRVSFIEAANTHVDEMLSNPPTWQELHDVLMRVGTMRTTSKRADDRWKSEAVAVAEPSTDDTAEVEAAFDAAAEASANAERVETVIEAIEAEAEAPAFSPGDRVNFPYRGFAGYGEVVQVSGGNVKVRVTFYSTPRMRVAVAARPVIAYPASDLTPAA